MIKLSEDLDDFFREPLRLAYEKRDFHMCSARGIWDLPLLLKKEVFPDNFKLVRSRTAQSQKPSCEGTMIFELLLVTQQQTFIYVAEDYNGYDLSVISQDYKTAADLLCSLRSKYLRPPEPKKDCFYLINRSNHSVRAKKVELNKSFHLTPDNLQIRYDDGFVDWEEKYAELLMNKSMGLTILRGDPGTGKTSFLRHLIARLRDTHRFYMINLTDFNLLKDPEMVEFWTRELEDIQSESKMPQKRVIIIEDAELLLTTRKEGNRGHISVLLNMCDGLLGDFLQANIICTANCAMDELDPAVVRSGRLVAIKEFKSLKYAQALILAKELGVELREKRDYTLAEIYAEEPCGDLDVTPCPKIGFLECQSA